MQKSKEIKEQIAGLEKLTEDLKAEIAKKLSTIGNLVHESVPVSKDEKDNAKVREWGEFKVKENAKWHHNELLHMIDGYDRKRGTPDLIR